MNKFEINLVYFSCARDFEMLKLSIDSSRRNYDFNQIYIFSDPNDPIEPFGFQLGNDIVHTLRTFGTKKLYGLDNISDMHECLKFAAEGCDYVLKKDSDILDCSSYAYDALNKGNWDCYGAFPMARENLIPENHFNGNAYFIKSSVIQQFPKGFAAPVVAPWGILNYPEDMVTSAICSTITKNVKIDGAAHHGDGQYLFDVYLSDIAAKSVEDIKKYGFAHCRSNPRIMEYLHNKLYISQ